MKTRTEEEMLSLILSFAHADGRIRVVVMNGSHIFRRPCGDGSFHC